LSFAKFQWLLCLDLDFIRHYCVQHRPPCRYEWHNSRAKFDSDRLSGHLSHVHHCIFGLSIWALDSWNVFATATMSAGEGAYSSNSWQHLPSSRYSSVLLMFFFFFC
jgi:hypothetical protein